MSGPHLGARVTPLVDGRLAADAELRAQDHLRTCCDCHEDVEAERLVRARLTTLGAPEVSPDLMARLLDIGGPCGPLPPRDQPMAVPARPVTGVAPPSRTDAGGPRAQRPAGRTARGGRVLRRRPVAAALAGTFSLLGAGIVGVLVLNGASGGAPSPVAEFRTTPSPAVTAPRTPAATSSASSVPGPAGTTSVPAGSVTTTAP